MRQMQSQISDEQKATYLDKDFKPLSEGLAAAGAEPPRMRAKMRVQFVQQHGNAEVLQLNAVGPKGSYPPDGSDEDNTYAKYTPTASLSMTIANPALFGKFKPGDTFYLDFTPAV